MSDQDKKFYLISFEYSHYLFAGVMYEYYGEKLHFDHFWELKPILDIIFHSSLVSLLRLRRTEFISLIELFAGHA